MAEEKKEYHPTVYEGTKDKVFGKLKEVAGTVTGNASLVEAGEKQRLIGQKEIADARQHPEESRDHDNNNNKKDHDLEPKQNQNQNQNQNQDDPLDVSTDHEKVCPHVPGVSEKHQNKHAQVFANLDDSLNQRDDLNVKLASADHISESGASVPRAPLLGPKERAEAERNIQEAIEAHDAHVDKMRKTSHAHVIVDPQKI